MEETGKNINEVETEGSLADVNEQEQQKSGAPEEILEASEPDKPIADEIKTENTVTEEAAEKDNDGSADAEATAALSLSPEDTAPTIAKETLPEELPKEEKSVYRWNYGEQKEFNEKKNAKKEKSSVGAYAAVMTCAFIIAFTALVLLLVANMFGIGPADQDVNSINPPAAASERIVYVREYDPESGILTTQEIYNKCLPSIVSISTSNSEGSYIGSGFIISEDGYIVTANHVVQDMSSITVVLNDGKRYAAQKIDGNEFTDLALIKIGATGLPALEIGSSSDLLVGDHVVAIGTPASIDFAGSLSDGTVSYNNRILKIYGENGSTVEKKMTLIQTNALVNPGNSGCPLLNEYGEVVGVISMKLNSSYYEGMCFAIPSDGAMPIIEAMKNGEDYTALLSAVSVYPAKMGVTVENATTSENIPGVKITSFASSQYDIYSKMKVGDIIVGVNDITVSSTSDLSYVLDGYRPGDTIEVIFYRGTQKMSVYVVLS